VAYRNLDEFLTRLEQAGDVARFTIDKSESDTPGIAAQDANKVHLFTDSNGTRIARNLFGTGHRIEQALRVTSLDLISERLEQLLEIGKPGAVGVMVSRAMTMFSAIRTTTNRRAQNEFQKLSFVEWKSSLTHVIEHAASTTIQATLLTGGSAPLMAAVAMQVTTDGISGTAWPELEVGETVALVVGGDPAFVIAAHAPLPDIVHRSYFASWLRDKPLDMMRLPGLDIELPSNAETVIVAAVRERSGDDTLLEVEEVWAKPNATYLQLLPTEAHNLRDAFVEIMSPLLRRFLPGVQQIRLRNQLGVLAIDPDKTDRQAILRQLWAVPISANVYYWLLLPETDDIDFAVERLMPEDINSLSKLTQGNDYLGILLDASTKQAAQNSSELDVELEQIFLHFKRNWRPDQLTGES
jgi:hypothetical protein